MIIIRADANEIIGTGHVMRCLSVADAFLSIGEKVLFITADHSSDRLIEGRGYESVCLESNWAQMDDEIDTLKVLIASKKADLMLTDSYYVTPDYFRNLTDHVKQAYFDDMNTDKWDVDYLINYNVFAESMDYSYYSGKNTHLLLGPVFAPLRKEFIEIPPHVTYDRITDVMVSAGGADPEMITERIMEKVCPEWPDVKFHFVVGALNPRINNIRKNAGGNVVLHVNEQRMSELMKKCDIAISAAGSTLYELCSCGVPTITYTLADNQLIAAEHFDKQGIMLNAGDCRSDDSFVDSVLCCLDILTDKEKRREYSYKMQSLVDGNGAERLARRLIGK